MIEGHGLGKNTATSGSDKHTRSPDRANAKFLAARHRHFAPRGHRKEEDDVKDDRIGSLPKGFPWGAIPHAVKRRGQPRSESCVGEAGGRSSEYRRVCRTCRGVAKSASITHRSILGLEPSGRRSASGGVQGKADETTPADQRAVPSVLSVLSVLFPIRPIA